MLKKILLILSLGLIVLSLVISRQPADFTVTRSANIMAPSDKVFEQVNNLRNWEAWSPWAKLDPNAKNSYEGPEAGAGASMQWAGNNDVGEGRMTITESKPSEFIRMRLDFVKPMKATNVTEFTFKPAAANPPATTVTWTMSGTNDFIGKAFNLVFDCDKMVGGQFEKGLENLRGIVENPASR